MEKCELFCVCHDPLLYREGRGACDGVRAIVQSSHRPAPGPDPPDPPRGPTRLTRGAPEVSLPEASEFQVRAGAVPGGDDDKHAACHAAAAAAGTRTARTKAKAQARHAVPSLALCPSEHGRGSFAGRRASTAVQHRRHRRVSAVQHRRRRRRGTCCNMPSPPMAGDGPAGFPAGRAGRPGPARPGPADRPSPDRPSPAGPAQPGPGGV